MPSAACGSAAGVFNPIDQCGGRGSTFALSVLTHRGQSRLHPPGDGVVVESDDRNVLWNAQARITKSADDATRDGVGKTQDPRGPTAGVENRLHTVVPVVLGIGVWLADDDRLDIRLAECL